MLGVDLLEDTGQDGAKRWRRRRHRGAPTAFLLARALGDQRTAIGRQGGGRLWFFQQTDNFERDHTGRVAEGVAFKGAPRADPYGRVAVFRAPCSNLWNLLEDV